MSDTDAVAASAKGATFLILLQIGSRAVTFALNQILLRFLSPELLGAAVRLELLVISILYFSRESLRIATQRRANGGIQAAVNLSYLAIAAGLPLGLLFRELYLRTNHPEVPFFKTALLLSQVTALIELCSEPAFVAVQHKMLYKTRASAEATGVVVKTFVTVALVLMSKRQRLDLGVLPFAVGELSYSSTLTLVYIVKTTAVAQQDKFTLLPSKIVNSTEKNYLALFSQSLVSLSASLYLQTGVKWLLTEGDKFLIAAWSTLEDQGMYALSANYGGLIARMLFRPIEDSSRNLFASLCSATENQSMSGSKKSGDTGTNKNRRQAAVILGDILKVYNVALLLVFAVGPTAAPLLLQIVAGSRWVASGAGDVLATYCYCIPLLAVNGVSEAFVSATASTKELQRQSFWMTMFSAGFAMSAFVFLRVLQLGARGLVWANCVNMALRIGFNLFFIRSYFETHGVQFSTTSILPNQYLTAAGVVVSAALYQYSRQYHEAGLIIHLMVIALAAVLYLAMILLTERKFLQDAYRRLRR